MVDFYCIHCRTPLPQISMKAECAKCGGKDFTSDAWAPRFEFALGERRPIALVSPAGVVELMKQTPDVHSCRKCGWIGIHPVQDPEDQPDDAVPFDCCPVCQDWVHVVKHGGWVDVDKYKEALMQLKREFPLLDTHKHKWSESNENL